LRALPKNSGERSSRLSKFHTLDIASRLDKLETAGFVTPEQKAALQGEGLSIESASSMVENVVAVFGMPMGVSLNMTVNGEDVVVPMVIEEPSVVAAVGNVARMTRPEGFTASSDDPIMIGQMHVRNVADPRAAKAALEAKFEEFTEMVHAIQPNLLKRGGGVRGWEAKVLVYDEPGEEREESVVLNFFMDCRDAMGANMVASPSPLRATLSVTMCTV
jgi:hydroxymethylglutaryl-CoA reductase